MPVQPEVSSNLFDSSLIFNTINPAAAVAAPFTYDESNTAIVPFVAQKVRVVNLVLTMFGVGAGVTVNFAFRESPDFVTWNDVPNSNKLINTAAPYNNAVHMARIETQWMSGSFICPKVVIGGAGNVGHIVGTFILHNLETYPDIYQQLYGVEVPQLIVDLNQKEMF